MIEPFAEYAIAHESGHAVVGQFVRIGAPSSLSFRLCRGLDGQLYLGDFATSFLFPPDDEIPNLPQAVKNCLCYTLAAGFAATQFSGLSLPDEKKGLDSDRNRLAKLTSESLEYFVPHATAVIRQEQRAYERVISECKSKYEHLKQVDADQGDHILLSTEDLTAIFKRTMSPLRAPLPSTKNTESFQITMSAHEAGHATVGLALGARVEAVYAVIREKLPSGNFSISYLTKFGALAKRGLDIKDQILLAAAGAAGERFFNGTWDQDCVARDRTDLEELGVVNLDYCVEQARSYLALLTSSRKR